MTHITLFAVGRAYPIPLSTVYVGQRVVGIRTNHYLADVLILNNWFDRKQPDNDLNFTVKEF